MNEIDPHIRLIVIDSFCGAGGVTEGFHRAEIDGHKIAKVIIGINHDAKAIKSHAKNHPDTVHFIEDFTTLDANKLVPIVKAARLRYPNAKLAFHASADCTHHSKAKGGMSRDADSRSLPEHIERYVRILHPDIVTVENVTEFIDWGPLEIKVVFDKQGNALYCPLHFKKKKKKTLSIGPVWKPIKERKGEFYVEWRDELINLGYDYDYKVMNAADYGGYQSRIRYFGIFSQSSDHIAFPIPTHNKNGTNGLEKHLAVKDVLELDIEGESIFDREKPLVDATLLRIIAGLYKFVINGNNDFMLKYNSMSQRKTYVPPSVLDPCPTVSCQDRIAVVRAKFMSQAFSGKPKDKNYTLDRPSKTVTTRDHHQLITAYYGNGYSSPLTGPCGTVTTKDRWALITSKFIANSYSGGGQTGDLNEPCPTLMTIPKQNIVSVLFMDQQYGQSNPASVMRPCGAVTANPKYNLVHARWLMDTQFSNQGRSIDSPAPTITANRKHFYLMNPQFANKGSDINRPCFTLIARMDKMPPYLMTTVTGDVKIKIFDTDTEVMKRLKNLCNDHGIIDVMMRMLLIVELLRIQGFGDDYELVGTQTDMKRFIGNAVECNQAKVLAEAIAETINTNLVKQAV